MTPMGKRKFNYTLLNPVTDSKTLTKEYDICEYVIKKNDTIDIRSLLSEIKDIEKLTRKILLKKITPVDMYYLHINLKRIIELYDLIDNDEELQEYTFKHIKREIKEYALKIMKLIENVLDLEKCKEINNLEFDLNFINKKYSDEHNKKVETWMDSFDKLNGIKRFLNDKITPYENSKKTNEFIKIHSTEKMGYSIITTKRRSTILNNEIKKLHTETIEYFSSFNNTSKTMDFDCQSVEYSAAHGSNNAINNPQIKSVCSEIIYSKQSMVQSVDKIYKSLVASLSELTFELDEIVKFVATIDLLYCKSYIATNYNYCKPKIVKTAKQSFVNEKGLRHPLIETLLQNELYVTNDINLDEKQLGILLYGTNAVGKSSFIKALGISVILAQAGFYVPCSQFKFKPFKHIFTRILGNDNLFKGLSSFAVEMLEFKTILNLADKNSLILGDELCSGTESNSAISIFLAGIDHLYKKQSNFIFATHFHEIVHLEEIKNKEKLSLKHMTVIYDKSKDKLMYDRKLKNGAGESMYGLEVCKSLHLPNDFLLKAHEIRNKYNKSTSSILEYEKSRYNSKKLKGVCEMCKEVFSSEVHHIQQQKDANDHGYIGSINKNHVANLMAVCEACHQKIHHKSESVVSEIKKPTGSLTVSW